MKVFIAGIGTEVGKTVVSAILAEAFHADYWKPIQTGLPDTEWFRSLISNQKTQIIPPCYTFRLPASPHIAAAAESETISLKEITLPLTSRPLIVEGAGGLLVPLNEHMLMIDLISLLQLPVILVSRAYLGCINHTLLSIECLKHRNLHLIGIIMNGKADKGVEDAILSFGHTRLLARVGEESHINPTVIRKYADAFKNNLLFKEVFEQPIS